MKEVILKYDSIFISDNEIEFRRIHTPPLNKMLCDIFINPISFVYLYIPFFYFLMKLLGISISCIYVFWLFLMILFYSIMSYRKKHRNIKIPINQIVYSYIRKHVLYVYYKGGIKLVEIGNENNKNRLQELSALKFNSIGYRRKRNYRLDVWLGAIGICISVILLVAVGKMNKDNDMPFVLGIISFVICIFIFVFGIINLKMKK